MDTLSLTIGFILGVLVTVFSFWYNTMRQEREELKQNEIANKELSILFDGLLQTERAASMRKIYGKDWINH